MIVYYCMLAGLSVVGAVFCWKKRSRMFDGIFLLIAFAVLATLSAIRYDVGIDYSYIYGPIYENIRMDPTGEYLANHRWEPAFKLLCLITMTLSENYQLLFVITSVLIVGLVMGYYWFRSPNPFISVFLFITLSQYYCSMNFLRQMLAAAIALYALPLARKRTPAAIAGYFALVLLAASFHQSALILIPAYLLFQLPFNRITLAAYGAATVLIYFNTHHIIGFVTQYWYPQYGLDNKHMVAAFEFPFTLAVVAVFIIVFLGRNILLEIDPRNVVYLHCAYFTFFFVLIGTRHSIVDRLSMYFEMAATVAIAMLVHHLGIRLQQARENGEAPQLSTQSKAAFTALLVTVYGGGLAIHQYALIKDYHGVDPYQTIFQQDFYDDYIATLRGEVLEPKVEEPEDPELPAPVEEPSSSPSEGPLRPQAPEVEPFQPEEPAEGELREVTFEEYISG